MESGILPTCSLKKVEFPKGAAEEDFFQKGGGGLNEIRSYSSAFG